MLKLMVYSLGLALLTGGLLAGCTALAPQPAPPGGLVSPTPAKCEWVNYLVPTTTTQFRLQALFGIAAAAPTDVWAVGWREQGSLQELTRVVEHWDGLAWHLAPDSTEPGTGRFLAVQVKAADDVWAVGISDSYSASFPPIRETSSGLMEHWDGHSWSAMPSLRSDPYPAGSAFYAVAAISSHDIWAVGFSTPDSRLFNGLTAHWDGLSWRIVSNPVPFQGANNTVLKGVAAIATDDVWAVGDSDGTLTLHWDGLAWRVVPSPSPRLGVPRLEGVVALAANDVWAVGSTGEDHFRQSLIEHWDGRTWNVVPSPAAEPVDSELLGLAAATPDDIWAVGIRHRPDGAKSLVEHWDGHAWRVVPSANVDSGKALSDTGLNAVAVRGDDVWTAGYFSHYQNGPEQMLIQHWNCGTRITPLSLTGKP